VKILKTDWEQRELEYNNLLEEIAALKAENEELKKSQSDFLIDVVKKQSAEIARLSKYQEQDDLLFSYEQSNDEKNKIIETQNYLIEELEEKNKQLLISYQKVADMNKLLISKIKNNKYECETYKTVSTFKIWA